MPSDPLYGLGVHFESTTVVIEQINQSMIVLPPAFACLLITYRTLLKGIHSEKTNATARQTILTLLMRAAFACLLF